MPATQSLPVLPEVPPGSAASKGTPSPVIFARAPGCHDCPSWIARFATAPTADGLSAVLGTCGGPDHRGTLTSHAWICRSHPTRRSAIASSGAAADGKEMP